jgi:hypothetical protein
VAEVKDKVRMRVEEAVTGCAAQAGPRHERVAISEYMALDVLLAARATAALAYELAVEGLERLALWFEFVGVSFDSLSGNFRVHLDELRHFVPITPEP